MAYIQGNVTGRGRQVFVGRPAQALRYDVSKRTIERWGIDPAMNMPPEYDFNGRPHRKESDLERWERSRVVATTTSKKTERKRRFQRNTMAAPNSLNPAAIKVRSDG
jgi:hypothetical protein